MKAFYRNIVSLCLLLAVTFVIVGTATAESNLSGSGDLNPLLDGKLPAVDFSVTRILAEYPHYFFFKDHSEYTDYVTCDFGDTNRGRYDGLVNFNNTRYIGGISHYYANDGIYKITFTGHNQYGINSKTIYLNLKNDDTYEVTEGPVEIRGPVYDGSDIGQILSQNGITMDATEFAAFSYEDNSVTTETIQLPPLE